MTITNKDLQMSIQKLQEREASLREMTLNASDMELKKKFHLELLAVKEEIEKIRLEMKILETPTQQLLPEIFEQKRAIPNSFLRGALFGVVKKGKRSLVKDEEIFSMSQYDIIFSGEYLDQNDLELWDTLIFLAKNKSANNQLKLTLYEIIKTLRLQDTGINRKAIIKRIERLKFGMLKISKKEKTYYGNLIQDAFIDEVDGKLIITFNNRLVDSFSDKDYTLISVDIRQLIGDNQLARWLYNFYESHKEPIPFAINFLQKLCRSNSEPKEFKRLLKHSLEIVKQAYLTVNIKANWDYEITKENYLIIHKTGKKKQQQLFSNT